MRTLGRGFLILLAVNMQGWSVAWGKDRVLEQLDRLDSYAAFWHEVPPPGDAPARHEVRVSDGADSSLMGAPELAIEYKVAKLNQHSIIPMRYHSLVRRYIDLFTVDRRERVEKMMGLADLYFPLFREVLDRHRLPQELVYLAVVESALNQESITFTITAPNTYLVVESYHYPSAFTLTSSCILPPENCDNNGVDDDLNGYADCDDPACANAPHCLLPDEVCDNNLDDDQDGQVDCDDSDCQGTPACGGAHRELACNDGVDNDNDGAADCADTDCANRPYCGTNNDGGGSSSGCSTKGAPSSPLSFLLLLLGFLLLRPIKE